MGENKHGPVWQNAFCAWRKKTNLEKSQKGIWQSECPGSVPGIKGRPMDTRDVWADFCGNSNSRGRMSAGQTGHMTGQMGLVHGTDGTHTKGCPAKILYVYWFFSPHLHARWIQEGFKGGFLWKHLDPIWVAFLRDSVRILGVCPSCSSEF